jgi:ribose 5-phosphate isomerase A
VDESKLVKRLGERWAVPVEVLSFALGPVMRRLKEMGGEPILRMGVKKDGPVISDEGNLIIDVRFPKIDDPPALERELNCIPGVLENGIFANVATYVLVAPKDGGEIRTMEQLS